MKRNLIQALLALALFGVVVQVVLIAPHAVKDHESPASNSQGEDSTKDDSQSGRNAGGKVDQSIKGMHMIETNAGGKEWDLTADQADRIKEKDLLKLYKVKTIFFGKSGVTFTTTGDEGTVEVKTKNMRISGNVVTKSSNGYTFTTSYLDYQSEKKLLKTDAAVEMIGPADNKGPGLRLTGKGMEAQLPDGTMEILAGVHADKTFSSRKVDIRSRRAIFNSHDQSARFLGDAVLDMATMRITGSEARLDYDSKKGEIRTLTVLGAKVSDVDKWATADNLKVDLDTDKFTFWGHPRVVQNNDELKGDEIVFLNGGKRVQVHRARAKMDEKRMGKVN